MFIVSRQASLVLRYEWDIYKDGAKMVVNSSDVLTYLEEYFGLLKAAHTSFHTVRWPLW